MTRSHRRGPVDWAVLPLLLLRPYRCRQCSARHLGFILRKRKLEAVAVDADRAK